MTNERVQRRLAAILAAASHPFPDEATRQHFIDGYRKAGLPD